MMLEYDLYKIGNRLLHYRKKMSITQIEAAEKAGISDRTYADIERGTVNMRIETFIRICNMLQVLPNDLLMEENSDENEEGLGQEKLMQMLKMCSKRHRRNAKIIMSAFLSSVNDP